MVLADAFLSPELTQGYAMFILGILTLILYAGMRLYSTIVVASWGVTVVTFMGVVIYGIPILLFYFSVISSVMLIVIASLQYSQR